MGLDTVKNCVCQDHISHGPAMDSAKTMNNSSKGKHVSNQLDHRKSPITNVHTSDLFPCHQLLRNTQAYVFSCLRKGSYNTGHTRPQLPVYVDHQHSPLKWEWVASLFLRDSKNTTLHALFHKRDGSQLIQSKWTRADKSLHSAALLIEATHSFNRKNIVANSKIPSPEFWIFQYTFYLRKTPRKKRANWDFHQSTWQTKDPSSIAHPGTQPQRGSIKLVITIQSAQCSQLIGKGPRLTHH